MSAQDLLGLLLPGRGISRHDVVSNPDVFNALEPIGRVHHRACGEAQAAGGQVVQQGRQLRERVSGPSLLEERPGSQPVQEAQLGHLRGLRVDDGDGEDLEHRPSDDLALLLRWAVCELLEQLTYELSGVLEPKAIGSADACHRIVIPSEVGNDQVGAILTDTERDARQELGDVSRGSAPAKLRLVSVADRHHDGETRWAQSGRLANREGGQSRSPFH